MRDFVNRRNVIVREGGSYRAPSTPDGGTDEPAQPETPASGTPAG